MYTIDQVHRIREMYFGQGKNLSEIAETVGCDWRTVRKYVDKTDFSPKPPAAKKEEKLQSSVIHKSQRRSFVQHIRRKRSLKGRHRPPYERAGRLLIQAFHHQKSGKSNMFNCAG